MALNSAQIATNDSTPTALLVASTSTPPNPPSNAGQFYNITGNVSDPLPVILKNIDATNTVYIGGSNVSTSNGYPLAPGASLPMQLINNGDIPYGISSTGTPLVAVLVGRQ